MKNEPWKRCEGCLCTGNCPKDGLEDCIRLTCAGAKSLEEMPKKEDNNGS